MFKKKKKRDKNCWEIDEKIVERKDFFQRTLMDVMNELINTGENSNLKSIYQGNINFLSIRFAY